MLVFILSKVLNKTPHMRLLSTLVKNTLLDTRQKLSIVQRTHRKVKSISSQRWGKLNPGFFVI